MSKLVAPAGGGLAPINGPASATIEDAAKADSGKPGQDFVAHPANMAAAANNISFPVTDCDSVGAGVRQQQRQTQKALQGIVTTYLGLIEIQVQKQIQGSATVQNLTKQLDSLQQKISQAQAAGQDLTALLAVQEIQLGQLGRALAMTATLALAEVAQQNPQTAKVAAQITETSTAALSRAVSERLLGTATQGLTTNLSKNYAANKAVQTVAQACFR